MAAQTKEGIKSFGTKAAAAAMWFQSMGRTDFVSDDETGSPSRRANQASAGSGVSALKEGDSLLDLVGGGRVDTSDMQTISPPLNMPVSPLENNTETDSSSELKRQPKPPESVDLLS